jgi:hypothetical protein
MLFSIARIALIVLAFNAAQFVSCYAQSFPNGSTDASNTLARLAIDVRKNVAANATIRQPLEELGRERCDKEAIFESCEGIRPGRLSARRRSPR